MKKRERSNLAAALNNLLASPTFCSWRKGASLDIAEWVAPKNGRTPAVIVSVAHLDEEERALVLGVLLEEILSWVRGLYRALSNAGLWCLGRLQTDADRARVLDGIAGSSQNGNVTESELGHQLQRLAPRWFIVKNAHAPQVGSILLNPRHTMTLMRGPMTRGEVLEARRARAAAEGVALPRASVAPLAPTAAPTDPRSPSILGDARMI